MPLQVLVVIVPDPAKANQVKAVVVGPVYLRLVLRRVQKILSPIVVSQLNQKVLKVIQVNRVVQVRQLVQVLRIIVPLQVLVVIVPDPANPYQVKVNQVDPVCLRLVLHLVQKALRVIQVSQLNL